MSQEASNSRQISSQLVENLSGIGRGRTAVRRKVRPYPKTVPPPKPVARVEPTPRPEPPLSSQNIFPDLPARIRYSCGCVEDDVAYLAEVAAQLRLGAPFYCTRHDVEQEVPPTHLAMAQRMGQFLKSSRCRMYQVVLESSDEEEPTE